MIDYSVEVAQDASIADPRVRHIMDGIQLLVDVRRLPDRADLLVFGDLRVADLTKPIETRRIGATRHGNQELPELRETRCLFSGRVVGKSGLAVWSVGDPRFGEPFVVTIHAKRVSRPKAQQPQFSVLPVEGLMSIHGMGEGVHGPRPAENGEDLSFPGWEDTPEPGGLYEFLGDELVDELLTVADCLVSTAGPARDRQLLQLLSLLADEAADDVEIDLQTEGHRIVMPCLSGRELIATRGVHRLDLWEYEVEIAGEEQIARPITRRVFDGLHCRVLAGPETQAVRPCRVSAQVLDAGEPRERVLGSEDLGPLFVHSPTTREFPFFGRIEAGKPIEIGSSGPDRMLVRVR